MTPSSSNQPSSTGFRWRRIRLGAFTLAEVMVSVGIFTWLALGVYTMLIKAYELSQITRCMDDGRAALATFGDQFLRLQTTDQGTIYNQDGTSVSGTWTRWMFQPTSGATTGTGLNWGSMSDTHGAVAVPATPSLNIHIGGAGLNVPAQISRQIDYVDPNTGATSLNKIVATSGGYMMQATFTITYQVMGTSHRQTLVTLRYVP